MGQGPMGLKSPLRSIVDRPWGASPRIDAERFVIENMADKTPHNLLKVLRNRHTERYYSECLPGTDSGVDVYVSRPLDIVNPAPAERFTLHSEFFCEFAVDGEPSGFKFVPRSSISKTPLMMANSEGIIDSSYRGELLAKVRSDASYTVNEGDRLFQIVAPDFRPIRVELVDSLSETARGESGFGSTGK